MQLLATSPEIAFDRVYPYERRYFSYLLEWSRVLGRREWDQELWPGNPTEHLPRPHGLVGPLPWRDRSLLDDDEGKAMSERSFELVWQEFSSRAADVTRRYFESPDAQVRYYAQKITAAWRFQSEESPRVQVLALVRDPRDTFLSYLAFHDARPGGFITMRPGETRGDYVERFVAQQRRRFQWLARMRGRDDVYLCPYEQLVRDLPAQATRISEWLGVALHPEQVIAERDRFKSHMTSDSPEASIERWKREMDPQVCSRFTQEMAPELTEFGFDLEAVGAA
jgi:Sulfotransferase family